MSFVIADKPDIREDIPNFISPHSYLDIGRGIYEDDTVKSL